MKPFQIVKCTLLPLFLLKVAFARKATNPSPEEAEMLLLKVRQHKYASATLCDFLLVFKMDVDRVCEEY